MQFKHTYDDKGIDIKLYNYVNFWICFHILVLALLSTRISFVSAGNLCFEF